ncbi:MAG TPA: TrkH family potassium uptake protein, partial [Solirubrobacteraceae bacterium]|nr:TrkH family potassium uptake protein [Solirubrobacteraceae bacterium]
GGVLKWVGAAFVVPAAVALGYGEPVWPFLVAGAITAGTGHALDQITGPKSGAAVGPRESFLVVALIWLLIPVFGALPFLLGDVPQLSNPINAYFESVSGFTATGATVLTDIEGLDRSMLFWRQFSHWLGGMGIIVLAVAVLPRLRIGGRQLLQSELAGPTEIERFSETIRETARRLWKLYAGLTVVAILALAVLGWTHLDPEMTLFDAVAQALSVVALGGFSSRNTSIAGFAPITQYVLLVLMIVAGINFLRLYRVLVQRHVHVLARDEELRLYLVFAAVGSALVVTELLAGELAGGEEAFREGTFQAVAVMTTTGFGVADSNAWGPLATMTLLLLMFVGASAGSTGGSIKVVRHLLLFKLVRRELHQAVHREAVVPIRASGVVIDERALRSAVVFVLLYLVTFVIGTLALLLDARAGNTGLAVFEAIGASAACLGNVGAAFGFAGPFGSYAQFSDLSTGVLTLLMWLGRVELVPVAVLLARSYWRA